MTRGLEGITVVSVEQAVAAPLATCRLTDAGARVIKIERPEGDFARHYDRFVLGQSAYYVWLNRGKESICLDLKNGEDRDLLDRLLARADVFVQNLKPGVLERIGLSQAALRVRHPGLIACEITGFGHDGPNAHLKAYDLTVQAETGLCSITGSENEPARVGVSVCDIAAGMNAHAAILEALFRRARTGEGASIRVSLFDSLADWMNVPYLQHAYGNHETRRSGVNHASLAPYGAYLCGDGKRVIFSVQNDREWVSFCTNFLGDSDLAQNTAFADNSARLRNRAALDAVIVPRFEALSLDEAMARLESAGIAYGRLNGIGDLAAHPNVRRLTVQTPGGPVDMIASAPIVDADVPQAGAVARLGADTAKIRAEFMQTGKTV